MTWKIFQGTLASSKLPYLLYHFPNNHNSLNIENSDTELRIDIFETTLFQENKKKNSTYLIRLQ